MEKQTKYLSKEREDLFISIAENIDAVTADLIIELDLGPASQETLGRAIKKIEEKIRTDIKNFSERPDYKAIGEDDDALESVLDACLYPSEEALRQMAAQLEFNGYRVIKCQSLAAEIYIDGVIERLEQNPYTPAVGRLFR